tara:strand:+ start:13517 stop:14359 length:843 start_codon:yes stop_codon:yes gene_type:complete
MTLKAIHATLEEIPEAYRELYTEKDGKHELTGIEGVKTSADIARVNTALEHEKTAHKETKAKLTTWGDLDHDDVTKKLDRIAELEAAAGDKLDEAKLDELANRRADGIVKTKVAPLERELKAIKKTNEELTLANGELSTKASTRSREDMLRPLLIEAKVLPEHHEDVFLYAERHLETTDDGKWLAREGLGQGLTAGSLPKDWLAEMLDKRPGWLPGSKGGGARGSGPSGGFLGGPNPWAHDTWNMTQQGQYHREHGAEKAAQAAKAAGTTVGGQRPAAKK